MSSENIGPRKTKPLSTACRRPHQHWNPDGNSVRPWPLLHTTFPVSLRTPEADRTDQLVTPRFQNTQANSTPWHSVLEFNTFPTLRSFVLMTYSEFLLDISCSRKKNEKENLISWISCQLQFNSKVCCKTRTKIPSCSCPSLSPPPTDWCQNVHYFLTAMPLMTPKS